MSYGYKKYETEDVGTMTAKETFIFCYSSLFPSIVYLPILKCSLTSVRVAFKYSALGVNDWDNFEIVLRTHEIIAEFFFVNGYLSLTSDSNWFINGVKCNHCWHNTWCKVNFVCNRRRNGTLTREISWFLRNTNAHSCI